MDQARRPTKRICDRHWKIGEFHGQPGSVVPSNQDVSRFLQGKLLPHFNGKVALFDNVPVLTESTHDLGVILFHEVSNGLGAQDDLCLLVNLGLVLALKVVMLAVKTDCFPHAWTTANGTVPGAGISGSICLPSHHLMFNILFEVLSRKQH